jgi:hypothetical protein
VSSDDDPAFEDDDDLFFRMKATWHVRHADGTKEDIVLEHGNIVEDNVGTVGQVIFGWA